MKIDSRFILHPLFIAALVLLLLNDLSFKYTFSNWITGKLSDFTGLLVFALFWRAIFPGLKGFVFISTFVLFIFWKSDFSQPVIDCLNSLKIFQIGRTIDCSDLMALLILPPAYWFEPKRRILSDNKAVIIALSGVAVFAFCATSFAKVDGFEIDKEYEVNITEKEFWKKLDSLNIDYQIDSVITGFPKKFCVLKDVERDNEKIKRVLFSLEDMSAKNGLIITVYYIQLSEGSFFLKKHPLKSKYKRLLEKIIVD